MADLLESEVRLETCRAVNQSQSRSLRPALTPGDQADMDPMSCRKRTDVMVGLTTVCKMHLTVVSYGAFCPIVLPHSLQQSPAPVNLVYPTRFPAFLVGSWGYNINGFVDTICPRVYKVPGRGRLL